MKKTLLSLLLGIAALGISGAQPVRAQAIDATGAWLATDVPYAPWTVQLKQDGTKLTGTMEQNGALRGPVDIYEGTINGSAIFFKANSPDGARAITFTGTISGNEITLNRATQIITGASQGGTGLFGTNAAPQFTIRRGNAAAAGVPITTTSGVQHWVVADGVAFKPWTLDLKIEGGTVTGVVGQASSDPPSGYRTSLIGPFDIYDGKANGNTIDFKVKTADGGRIITFHGTRTGDQIAFTRSVQVISGDPGRDGILGASGATQFIARLNPGNIAAVSSNPSPIPLAARANTPALAPTGPAGRWQATAVPNAPWTFEFTVAGTALTGTVQQGGASSSPVSIAAGKVDGTVISFKVLSPDAERMIAFNGRVNRNEISFVRQITVIADGTRGGNDLYGGSAPLQFVANRAASNRFNFKGVEVDVAPIQSAPDRAAVLDGLRRQIDIVDGAVTDPAQKAFLMSVPLIMSASANAGQDNAAYSAGSKIIMIQPLSYSPEKPVILHELMHAYHDQKVPNGFGNAEIQALYQQARTSGQFPANSYMLSNVVEYFAMMASVYLHGSAARDPFTRQAIQEKQPDCYQWLVKEFGPR
jgi:hypothetical protein